MVGKYQAIDSRQVHLYPHWEWRKRDYDKEKHAQQEKTLDQVPHRKRQFQKECQIIIVVERNQMKAMSTFSKSDGQLHLPCHPILFALATPDYNNGSPHTYPFCSWQLHMAV
jgi:hypothetical protein